MKVSIFVPCFIDQLFPDVAFNMVKVLEHLGCEVHYNTKQTCCGQPAFNSGFREDVKPVCRKFMRDFDGDEFIVTPSASCGGFVKNYYAEIFENEPGQLDKIAKLQSRMFEFSSFLVHVLKVEDVGASFNAHITYHDSCAALRECGIKQEPRTLLSHVKGLTLTEMPYNETCCGFGGTFAVKYTSISGAMGRHKAENALSTGADFLVSTDTSCLMHIQGVAEKMGKPLRIMHLADVLAQGIGK